MGTETIEFIESRVEGKFQLEINREKTRVVDLREPGASLAHISHRPLRVNTNSAPESVFHRPSLAIVSRMGITAPNSPRKGYQAGGKLFSFVPKPIASAAPHGLWHDLRLQVLLEVEKFSF
jgi:hypothetical protein